MEQHEELERRYPDLPKTMQESLDEELAEFRRVKYYEPPAIISVLFKAWNNFRAIHQTPLTYADIISIKGVFNLGLSSDEVICMFFLDRIFYEAANNVGE